MRVHHALWSQPVKMEPPKLLQWKFTFSLVQLSVKLGYWQASLFSLGLVGIQAALRFGFLAFWDKYLCTLAATVMPNKHGGLAEIQWQNQDKVSVGREMTGFQGGIYLTKVKIYPISDWSHPIVNHFNKECAQIRIQWLLLCDLLFTVKSSKADLSFLDCGLHYWIQH